MMDIGASDATEDETPEIFGVLVDFAAAVDVTTLVDTCEILFGTHEIRNKAWPPITK